MTIVTNTLADTTLYRHCKRPQWGLSILASEGETRRLYQFEDGQTRTFKKGYYQLLEPVDRSEILDDGVVRGLLGAVGARRARATAAREAPNRRGDLPTLEDQFAAFNAQFPAGFTGATWLSGRRGRGAKRHLKRHRDATIAQARRVLSDGAFEDAIKNEGSLALWERFTALLRTVDLVGIKSEVVPLESMSAEAKLRAVVALRQVLHGSGPMAERFDAFVAELPTDATWPMATVALALVHPDRYSCVRPASFKRQIDWYDPRVKLGTRPSGAAYMMILEMLRSIERTVAAIGSAPTDLMDVYDFIVLTAKPALARRSTAASKQ